MKKNIVILTTTRAEYGLLKNVVRKLINLNRYNIKIVVSGMHLSPDFGLTYREIENDGFIIDQKIEILLDSNTPTSTSKSMGLAMISFADYFKNASADMLIVLGDRFETLAVCTAAMCHNIPIAHLCGGETTEGAIDESIRHAITKMSYLHFVIAFEYRNRVIQLGEDPKRVFNYGSLGVENIKKMKLLNKCELEDSLKFSLKNKYAVVTYHPETMQKNSINVFDSIIEVIEENKNINYIFTKANADAGGKVINNKIDSYVNKYSNVIAFDSLGMLKYLSALKYASFVVGNSSSGIVEAPSFGIPTINVGDRQKGRIEAESIINCHGDTASIRKAFKKAMDPKFRKRIAKVKNPYENVNTSSNIVNKIDEYLKTKKINIKKKFFDL